jgi:hypothetical protein
MRKNKHPLSILIFLAVLFYGCTFTNHLSRNKAKVLSPKDQHIWQKLNAENNDVKHTKDLAITYPYDGTVFPPEIAAPIFQWTDQNPASTKWLLVFNFNNGKDPLYAISHTMQWTPDKETWKMLKTRSMPKGVELTISGVREVPKKALISKDRIRIFTSNDQVNASILYRQVPLPFKNSPRELRQMKWRLGDIASYDKPPVIMQNLSTCASCHLVSKDGRQISMEMNYRKDSGAQFIAPVSKNIKLSATNFMTWSDFPKPDLLP